MNYDPAAIRTAVRHIRFDKVLPAEDPGDGASPQPARGELRLYVAGAGPVMTSPPTILLLADRRKDRIASALRDAGYRLMTTFTPDQAVAICLDNEVHAVVLDQEHFIIKENWSVAQSLKMVKPRICVALIVRGELAGEQNPAGIDAMIPEGNTEALLETLARLF